mmetsp:Transcript_54333/g.142001  ORF Transcript_54333/g.142001 Transcript_54333/m.142001 type:complete len:105 (+) Transcript_54333:703-1017(+)
MRHERPGYNSSCCWQRSQTYQAAEPEDRNNLAKEGAAVLGPLAREATEAANPAALVAVLFRPEAPRAQLDLVEGMREAVPSTDVLQRRQWTTTLLPEKGERNPT